MRVLEQPRGRQGRPRRRASRRDGGSRGKGLRSAGRRRRGAPRRREAPPPPLAGQDFIDQARILFRLAACGGSGPIPDRFDAKMVEAHCKDSTAKYAEYKRQWVDVAMPYIAKLEPAGLPKEVVYPFGGSDLMSALATFPDATTYTTVSLEIAADIRRVDTITQKKLDAELRLNRDHLGKLFEKIHSRTVNLDIESKSDLPGEIVFSLVALAIYGQEPVSLRYFKFNPDGTLHYLTAEDIDTMEKADAAKKRSPADIQADIFGNVELQFRKAGDANAPVKTFATSRITSTTSTSAPTRRSSVTSRPRGRSRP